MYCQSRNYKGSLECLYERKLTILGILKYRANYDISLVLFWTELRHDKTSLILCPVLIIYRYI